MNRSTAALSRKIVCFGLAVFFAALPLYAAAQSAGASTSTASSLSREELETQVQAKAQELDQINNQLNAAKQDLSTTKNQRFTLERQLNLIQSNVNQLNLNIRADEITVQKLNLEIEALGYDLNDIVSSIQTKQDAIAQILQMIQKNENMNLLAVLLKSGSLADAVSEAQNLSDLEARLADDISNLRSLHDDYGQKIGEAQSKRGDIAAHQSDLQNRKAIVEDQKAERQTILKQTQDKESVFEQQVADLEKRQQEIANEVETLDAVLRTKIDPKTLPPLGHGVLAIPVTGDALDDITQGYGSTQFAKNGYVGHWHNGVDFRAPLGTPVLAAEDGIVAAVGNQDAYCWRGAYGRFIVINHNDNLTTLYGHLSRQIVQKGDEVKRDQVIGYSGMTGYATGPHLHFTVFAQPTFYMGPSRVCGQMPYGGDLNPLGYL